MRSSLEAKLAFLEDDDLGLDESPVVVRRSGALPLVPAAAARGWEVMATFGAPVPFLEVAAAAVCPSLPGPTPVVWVTGAIGLPDPCVVGFCWLPARAAVLIPAAFWASKTSQAFSPLSSLVLQIVLVMGNETNRRIGWLVTHCGQSLEVPSLVGLDGLGEVFGCCFSGDAVLRGAVSSFRAAPPMVELWSR